MLHWIDKYWSILPDMISNHLSWSRINVLQEFSHGSYEPWGTIEASCWIFPILRQTWLEIHRQTKTLALPVGHRWLVGQWCHAGPQAQGRRGATGDCRSQTEWICKEEKVAGRTQWISWFKEFVFECFWYFLRSIFVGNEWIWYVITFLAHFDCSGVCFLV